MSEDKVLFKFLSSNLFGAAVGVFTGFFTYRYIEPSQLGIWGIFAIIEIFCSVTRLGVINGLGRELPFYLGQEKQLKAHTLAQTALSYSIWSNLFLLIIIPITLSINNIDLSNSYYLFSLVVLLFKVIFNSYSSYLSVTYRTNSNFNDLSNLTFFQSSVKILSLIFVCNYGFCGLLFREVLLVTTETVLLHLKRPIKILPKFQFDSFLELLKIGLPLFFVSYLSGVVDTFPRLFILKYSDAEKLGLFSPVIVILGLSVIIPNAISSYIYPRMAFTYGAKADRREIWIMIKKTAYLSVLFSIPLSIFVFFGSDLISIIFPKYVNSIYYLKLTAFSVLFSGFKAGSISFSVIKNWKLMFADVVVFFIVTIVTLVLFKCFFNDILLVTTLSIGLTNFLMFFITISLAYRATH